MKRIAIIGSGISGLTAAYLLDNTHQVTVFEKNDYVGGHTATVDIQEDDNTLAIDTGFIVFNDRTYPLFNRLLERLNVAKQPTEMSFSVHDKKTGFEYNGHSLNTLFAQRENIVKPTFYKLIFEILRFNHLTKQRSKANQFDENETLGDFLTANQFSDDFQRYYILPMGSAIWSCSLQEIKTFSLSFFVRFFSNHGLLDITNRPQWYVVKSGSRQYVDKICEGLSSPVLLNSKIECVLRQNDHVELHMVDQSVQVFDEVIFACHSDEALALLGDASEEETKVLGAIKYSDNEVVLHKDTHLLPDRKLAWASWNYRLMEQENKRACVTYDMNILQSLPSEKTYCVTLNQTKQLDEAQILRKFVYSHPELNQETVHAQHARALICGQRNTHFVGAYWYNGFHEDGVRSAVDVATRFGATL